MTITAAQHNAAIRPLLEHLVSVAPTEPDQWLVLESLCLGVGKMHGLDARGTAEMVELIAERFASGLRD